MRFAALVLAAAAFSAHGADVPLVSPGDLRVRYIPYRADAAVLLKVRRGVVTRVILERDEKIKVTGTGFPSNCETAADEWCIRAQKDEYQIWIKPKTDATHNNVEVQTDKRDYSLKLEVLPDAPKGEAPPDEMFRVMFVYPARSAAANNTMASAAPSPLSTPTAPGRARTAVALPSTNNMMGLGCETSRPIANVNYSRETGDGSIVPLRIFDDGAHTVFVFGDAAPMPTVYSLDLYGAESRVNFAVDGNCLIVHQLGAQFMLRAGNDAIKVFNDTYAATAPSPRLRELRDNRTGEQ